MSDASRLLDLARRQLADGRDLDARLALAAALAELGRDAKIKPVVVGGTAVDFYAASSTPDGRLEPSRSLRASQDVDIITVGTWGDAARLRKILAASPDFYTDIEAMPVPNRRKWWVKGAPMLIEILSGELYGDPDRVTTIEVAGAEAYLWGPEDTAWQYMQVARSERNRMCWERARAIAAAQEPLDWAYLRTRVEPLAPVELVDALEAGDTFDEMMERVGSAP